MRFHAFQARNSCGDLRPVTVGFARRPLIGHDLDELADAEATGVLGSTLSGQDVIWTRSFVAKGYVGFFAQEQDALMRNHR